MTGKNDTTTIRGLNKPIYLRVKAIAALRNRKISSCVNDALIEWLKKNEGG